MSNFINGLVKTNNVTETVNGAVAYKSTLNANLDFYGKSGDIGLDIEVLKPMFLKALVEDQDLAIRNLLNMRDVRGGKGVRDNARKLLDMLFDTENLKEYNFFNLVAKFVAAGRWDDLFTVYGKADGLDNIIEQFFIIGLKSDNPTLVAKWTPLNQKDDKSKKFMSKLRSKLQLTPKQMRKFIVEKRNVVETKMCAGQWDQITYSQVPSQAMRIYKKAFGRQDEVRFGEFLTKVESGEEKINAGTLYPHEVSGKVHARVDKAAELQWKALPNYLTEGARIFPMVDVSGSMQSPSYGNYQCLDISVALGMYLAEKNTSIFKDSFITFHSNPEIVTFKEGTTLDHRKQITSSARWGGSTDIGKAFDLILTSAIQNEMKQEDFPEYFIVLSDMQFDQCGNKPVSNEVKDRFAKAGYELPRMIWWNLNARYANTPVTFDQSGNAFVSGFSPSLMTAILSCDLESFTPQNVMLSDLMQEKYNINDG